MDDELASKGTKPTALDERSIKAVNLNRLFFLAGLCGTPICVFGWSHWHQVLWLIGLGIFTYFIVSSITDAFVRSRRDIRELRNVIAATNPPDVNSPPDMTKKRIRKPLSQNPYFRAGIMGLPFCVFEWFWKHELVFLLGGGFFAGILLPTLYSQWKWNRAKSNTPMNRE